ncbi:DUF3365 domain-containing protein [Anaerolineales bacterium HSG25]|nr:DUF3365 domain-containing protein [Anaerolineales bacterium HSG25]
MIKLNLSVRSKMMIALGIVIIATLGTTFYWMAKRQEEQIIGQVHTRAEALFENAVLTRAWVAAQGGVFIEKRTGVDTNPFLMKVPDLEVELEEAKGRTYTLRNPALVTRELSELGAERGENFAFHITSLKPLNPNNAPTEWEAHALRSFEQGEKDATTIEFEGDAEIYRYMAPLMVTKVCLRCHQAQGYKIGDVRGGISVSVPMKEARVSIVETRQQLFLTGVATTITVLLILFMLVEQFVLRPLQEMEKTASEISSGQRDQRVPIRTKDELGSLANSFNQMTDQLQHALEQSEQLVIARTKRLETVATVSERLNAILDFNQLLVELVNQIKEKLGYYQAHVYLLDETKENLVFTEGTGKAGITMKANRHTVPMNDMDSTVVRSVLSKEVVAIDDIRKSLNWKPNPLLPDSRSKIIVPIVGKEEVVGVLAVHENRVAGLDEGDADLLRSLASHVSIALTNARLFEQTQMALEETEKLYLISRQMMSANDLSELVKIVVEGIALPAINRALLLVCKYGKDDKLETIRLRASWYSGHGTLPRPIGTHYTWAMSTVINIAHSADPLFFNDVQNNEAIDPDIVANARKRNVHSMVVLPLLNQDRQMGVLILLGEETYNFTEQEVRLYLSLTGRLAVAVENRRLLRQTQRRASELAKAKEELAQINANKDKFFSIVAHDLRGPFMPLLGTSELLAEMADFLEPTDIKEMGESLHRSVKNVHNLLENLLQWSRMQMGRMQYQPKRIALTELVRINIQLLTETATDKKISLQNNVQPDIFVYADQHMLDMVVRNLVSNALKFTPEKGQVSVSAMIKDDEQSFVKISVSDTGVGISQEDIDKLFKIELHHTTLGTAQEKGTGLGLVMCHEMVDTHGGEIWIESEIDKGTTFNFTVPLYNSETS